MGCQVVAGALLNCPGGEAHVQENLATLGDRIADRHVAAAIQDGFLVESSGGKKFDDVNLEEKEWCDFDEKLDAPVGIYEVESRFERHKGK